MAPISFEGLSQLSRGDGPGHEQLHQEERKRFARGNPPRFIRTRFVGFHIMFQEIDIRKPGQMIAALLVTSSFSLLATVFYFMMNRFEKRAVETRRGRLVAAPMFALRLMFAYTVILLVEVMNLWIIFAVAVGHALGWILYHMFIVDWLDRRDRRTGGGGDDGDDGGSGKGRDLDESSVSSESSDNSGPAPPRRRFWEIS